jgi:hypothetical protein
MNPTRLDANILFLLDSNKYHHRHAPLPRQWRKAHFSELYLHGLGRSFSVLDLE